MVWKLEKQKKKENWEKEKWRNKGTNKQQQPDSGKHNTPAHCPRMYQVSRSVRVAERLALPTSDHGDAGSNPAGGEILPEPKRRFIAQSLSCSPFNRLEMTEILLKGRKTLTLPSIRTKFQPLKPHSSWEKCDENV